MVYTKILGTILYCAIIIFNLTILYRVITSKSQVNFDVVTKITINQANIIVLIFSSILNILLMLILLFCIWVIYQNFNVTITTMFIANMAITRYKLYRLK